MKKLLFTTIMGIVFFAAGLFVSSAFAKQEQTGYILEHEADLAKEESAPHDVGGTSTAYNFFSEAADSKLVFRKRVLHAGSAIGYHLQKEEEIYYIPSGSGEMIMNNKKFTVNAGDAVLTFPGSSHGLKQTGTEELVVLINYKKHPN